MSEQNNEQSKSFGEKYAAPLVAVAIVAVVAAGSYLAIRKAQPGAGGDNQSAQSQDKSSESSTSTDNNGSTAGKSTTGSTSASTSPAETPSAVPSYTEALKLYEGRRIQLGDQCAATPNNITVKNNTKVMFDNRTAKPITLIVDGRRWSMVGYGYLILTMRASTFPHEISIDCSLKANVARVTVQK